jgi:hypothetical protein
LIGKTRSTKNLDTFIEGIGKICRYGSLTPVPKLCIVINYLQGMEILRHEQNFSALSSVQVLQVIAPGQGEKDFPSDKLAYFAAGMFAILTVDKKGRCVEKPQEAAVHAKQGMTGS